MLPQIRYAAFDDTDQLICPAVEIYLFILAVLFDKFSDCHPGYIGFF